MILFLAGTRLLKLLHVMYKRVIYSSALLMSKFKELHIQVKKKNQSHYRPEVPRVFQEVKVPRLPDNGPGWW